ncbi:MAG: anhydro-N-acetylmuramic acid kinase [Burkholderiaceae bacterium]
MHANKLAGVSSTTRPGPDHDHGHHDSPLFLGIMSGTSLDGLDAVLIKVDETGRPVRLGFWNRPMPEGLRETFLQLHDPLCQAALLKAQEACLAFAEEVSQLVRAVKKDTHRLGPIQALGVHGQTILHRPELGISLQLNAPAAIAERTGLVVVSDFRTADLAAKGQGAPLVPVFHEAMTGNEEADALAVLNLGGIANLTLITRERGAHARTQMLGFDTGPANMLMDLWAKENGRGSFDKDGEFAHSGQANPSFVDLLMQHPFFRKDPPKSTGRDDFNAHWLKQQLEAFPTPLSAADVQASLLALSCQSIAKAIPDGTQKLFLCGGGAKNPYFVQGLQTALEESGRGTRCQLKTTASLGWAVDEVEAAAFAWLAYLRLNGLPGNCPEVTGALGPRCLGSITAAGPEQTQR